MRAATYYAAPNGSSSNSGLSTNSPWSFPYAMANAGASNTIMLMDGQYANGSTVAFTVSSPYQTIKAINKWGPRFCNIGSPDGTGGVIRCLDFNGVGTVIDGLCFSNCQYYPILFHQAGLSNCVVRNCWILQTGNFGWDSSGYASKSGMQSYPGYNLLVERNVFEWNGTNASPFGYNHGIYTGGTNGIYRFNVCRYNPGLGLVIDSHNNPSSDVGNQVYGNLIYGNQFSGSYGDQLSIYDDSVGSGPSSGPQVNYIFGNTIISTGPYAISCQNGNIRITNNIIISSGSGILKFSAFSGDVINADYNLAPRPLAYSGPHDILSSAANFVNTANGLYWLSSSSPARGKALSAVCGPLNFFGAAQPSVTDIGAFQFNSTLTSDSRVLDPSSAPDYWASPSGTNSGGSASIVVSPASQTFGSIPVGSTADQSFTVQNNGTATLSGSASVPAPFSIVSGNPYSLGPGQAQTVTVRYSPTTAESDAQTVSFTGANGATAGVSGSAVSPGSLSFQASAGTLSGPFIVTNGAIYQTIETGVTNGGRAVYSFTITNAGSYVIQTMVNAPNTGANSFYVNIDADPVDPTMTWDIMPLTSGFEQRLVSWRGNGTPEADQFVPESFDLTAGTHQLIIIGRESNTLLQSLTLVELPSAPNNLHVVAGP